MQCRSLYIQTVFRIKLFTNENKNVIPTFFTLRVLCKRCLFPTVSTQMYTIIVVLLVLTVVGIPVAIVMIIYVFITIKGIIITK